MEKEIDNQRWKDNRHKLLQAVSNKCDLIMLAANRLQQRNSDVTYPFRQESSFYYYTGLEEPDLVYAGDLRSGEEWLITPRRNTTQRIFDGHTTPEELQTTSGLIVMDNEEGWQKVKKLASTPSAVIGTIRRLPSPPRQIAPNNAQSRMLKRLRSLGLKPKLVDVSESVARQRAIKQPWEIDYLQQAIDLTGRALSHVSSQLDNYKHEYEIEADITAIFRRANARLAYEPIVAAGSNALTLHYVKNRDSLRGRSSVLIDVGAEINNYCADITRTYFFNESIKPRQRAIYQAVLDMQTYAISLLKPGLRMSDYVHAIDKEARTAIKGLGLNPKHLRKYLPHGISHGLGLDVHDRLAHESLLPGMVLTVEPGLYIENEGIGIRIEDDLLITENGCKVLSADISKLIGARG